ncbi:MAG: rod-binding protein [Sphingomonadales bacterium]
MIGKVASPSATPKPAAPRPELVTAARAFEAVFVRQLISSMRSAKLGDDILGSSASDQFRDMADARIADAMAEHGSIGIANLLLKQFGKAETSK